MMRILVAMSLLALALACAHKDAGKLPGRKPDPGKETAYRGNQESLDSTFYVGYVDYFPETKEFFTALHYREGHEYPDEDLLESRLDSVIVFDDDWGRERLPMDEARKILVLSGLDTLCIYNRDHDLVGRAPLTRVEYLWNGLESYFIGVFKSDGKFSGQTGELYGVTASFTPRQRDAFKEVEIQDASLNEFLLSSLNLKRNLEWDTRHYRISPDQTTYSILSSYAMESQESFSYLTALDNGGARVLNEELDNFHYLNILPIPIRLNGKPLMLISAGYPSSDVIWDYLAGWNGNRFEPIDYNRVRMKDLDNGYSLPSLEKIDLISAKATPSTREDN